MAGKYVLKNVASLKGDKHFPNTDTYWQDGDTLYQYDIEDGEKELLIGPSMYSIGINEYGVAYVQSFAYNSDAVLEQSEHTKLVSDKVERFRSKLHIYAKYGIDVPKRSFLLYGPAGTGKSTIISFVCKRYSGAVDSDTAVIVWPTAKVSPSGAKNALRRLAYSDKVKHLILVIEDLGGVEVRNTEIVSDPELLSILDNMERVLKKPTFVLATTNHPEIFLGNLTNRPQRFDEKLEIGYPGASQRIGLAKFFLKEEATEEFLNELAKDTYKEFTPAHVKEAVLRAAIEEVTLIESLRWIKRDIDTFNKNFSKTNKVGM